MDNPNPIQVHQVMQQIKLSEWDDGIADISNWRFLKLDKYSRGHDAQVADSTLFVVKGELRLLGFEKVGAIWVVDEVDLKRADIGAHDDPEEAYMNYIKLNFGIYLSQVGQAVGKYKLHQMGLFQPKKPVWFPEARTHQEELNMNAFKNKLHERKKRLRKQGLLKH